MGFVSVTRNIAPNYQYDTTTLCSLVYALNQRRAEQLSWTKMPGPFRHEIHSLHDSGRVVHDAISDSMSTLRRGTSVTHKLPTLDEERTCPPA